MMSLNAITYFTIQIMRQWRSLLLMEAVIVFNVTSYILNNFIIIMACHISIINF